MNRSSARPPATGNTLAKRLIAEAQRKCTGCRLYWRRKGTTHGGKVKLECTALDLRDRLRNIAASARAAEKARSSK